MSKDSPDKVHILGSGAIAFILGLIGAGAVIAGINHFGLTYDEPIYAGFGTKAAAWVVKLFVATYHGELFQHLLPDTINRAWFAAIDMQPPFLQVLSGLSYLGLGNTLGGLLAPRLPAALLFGLAVGTLFWLTEKAFNREAGIFSALGLILLPRFFNDAHLATLDVPVSALLLAAAAFYYTAAEEDSWWCAGASGIFLGLALLTKLNATFLVFLLMLWSIIFHPRTLAKFVVAFFVITPLVFFAGWPWLWHDTLANLQAYLLFHLKHYPVLVYYLGKSYRYAPWHYPFVLTAVTMPAASVVLVIAGLGETLRRCFSSLKPPSSARSAQWLLLICGIGYLLPSALPFAPKYNGVRLFLPAFPFLMGLAGGGFALALELLVKGLGGWRALGSISHLRTKLALLLSLALLVPALVGLLRVYPNELAYYNAFIGGPEGARRRGLETIYWGGIYYPALLVLNADPRPLPRVLVTPPGVVSLLQIYQRGGELRNKILWSAPPAPEKRQPGWPQKALAGVDLVVFQCAQSEFDEISWKLYREGKPLPGSIYLEQTQVPLLLFFDGQQARQIFAAAEKKK